MKNILNNLLMDYNFPKECVKPLNFALDKLILDDQANELLKGYLNDYASSFKCDYKKMLDELEIVANRLDISVYTVHFILFALFTPQLKKYYQQYGYSQELCDASILDLRYKLDECILVKGVWGTFVPMWYVGFFTLEKFTLNRLQFRIIKYETNAVVDGIQLSGDTEFIDVHIPRSGARLDHEEVRKSYDLAVDFFAERFNIKTPIFFCSSWLLFQDNLKVLKPDSNMAKFIKDYRIIKEYDYEDYHEVWRLFDMEYDGNVDKLPADSSLRRSYIDWIRSGKKLGGAIGAFVYKK